MRQLAPTLSLIGQRAIVGKDRLFLFLRLSFSSLSRGGSSFRRGRGYINPEAISFVSKLSRLLHRGKDIERFKAFKLLSLHGDMKLSVLS